MKTDQRVNLKYTLGETNILSVIALCYGTKVVPRKNSSLGVYLKGVLFLKKEGEILWEFMKN